MIKLFVPFLLLITSNVGSAQSLSEDTDTIVADRAVLHTNDSSTNQQEITHNQGDLSSDHINIDDLFDLSLEDLLAMKVSTASRKSEKVADIPASIVVITRQDIELFGYRTLEEILENVPGLNIVDIYSWGGLSTGLRGSWTQYNNNVAILIDGVDQKNEYLDDYSIRQCNVPVEAIERIEVVKGPMSVLYGSGAFFGAINIITNPLAPNSNEGAATVSYGSQNTKKVAVSKSIAGSDFSISTHAMYYATDGMDIPFSNTTSMDTKGLTTQDLDWSEKRRYFGVTTEYKDFALCLNVSNFENPQVNKALPIEGGVYRFDRKAMQFTLRYSKDVTRKLHIDAKFTYSDNIIVSEATRVSEKMHYDILGTYYIADITSVANPTSFLTVTTGITHRNAIKIDSWCDYPPKINNLRRYALDGNFYSVAGFTQASIDVLDDHLTLMGGIRAERFSDATIVQRNMDGYPEATRVADPTFNDANLNNVSYVPQSEIIYTPRLALVCKISAHHVLKVLYNNATKHAPHLSLATDPSLKPEKQNTYECNYIGQINKTFSYNLSAYRNELFNMVVRTKIDELQNTYRSTNQGKVNTNGIELGVKVSPIAQLSVELDGCFQKSENLTYRSDSSSALGFSPSMLGYIKISYVPLRKLSLALTGNYVGSMESKWDVDNNKRFGDKIGSSFNLGANVRVSNIFMKGVYANVRIANILNQEIRYPTHDFDSWADKGTLGPSFNFLATLAYKF